MRKWYLRNKKTPEQSSLLDRPDFDQYPTEQELPSAGKGSESSNTVQENPEKVSENKSEGDIAQPSNVIAVLAIAFLNRRAWVREEGLTEDSYELLADVGIIERGEGPQWMDPTLKEVYLENKAAFDAMASEVAEDETCFKVSEKGPTIKQKRAFPNV